MTYTHGSLTPICLNDMSFVSLIKRFVYSYVLFFIFSDRPVLRDVGGEVLNCEDLTRVVLRRARRNRASVLVAIFVARRVLEDRLRLLWRL